MARGSLEQFPAAKGRVTGAPEVYVVQRMNPFAMLPEASPVLDLVFGRPSSTRTASRSGGLTMMNDSRDDWFTYVRHHVGIELESDARGLPVSSRNPTNCGIGRSRSAPAHGASRVLFATGFNPDGTKIAS